MRSDFFSLGNLGLVLPVLALLGIAASIREPHSVLLGLGMCLIVAASSCFLLSGVLTRGRPRLAVAPWVEWGIVFWMLVRGIVPFVGGNQVGDWTTKLLGLSLPSPLITLRSSLDALLWAFGLWSLFRLSRSFAAGGARFPFAILAGWSVVIVYFASYLQVPHYRLILERTTDLAFRNRAIIDLCDATMLGAVFPAVFLVVLYPATRDPATAGETWHRRSSLKWVLFVGGLALAAASKAAVFPALPLIGGHSASALVGKFGAVTLWTAIKEELVFRWVLLACLYNIVPFRAPSARWQAGIVISAAAFMLGHLHSDLASQVIAAVITVVTSLYVAYWRDLGMAILFHAVVDTMLSTW